ncbi:MAG TPA: hypothetical protein VH250_03620 [Granulicella sp.]|nr:hypothetical protein [Granulicella sp.]
MTFHLSHEQLCDHLLEATSVAGSVPAASSRETASTSGFHVVEDHLRACPLCAAELSSLQASLNNFQAATTSFANQELSLLRSLYPNRINLRSIASATPAPAPRLYNKPFAWAIAAGLVLAASLGTMLPRGLHHHPALHVASAVVAAMHPSAPALESDQALLEEVDDDLSSNVPSAMEPLSDPISAASASATAAQAESAPSSHKATARKITHE